MLNKKIALGLFAAFALVAPASANGIDALQTDQTIYSNTVAEDHSKAYSSNYQDLYVDQGNEHLRIPGHVVPSVDGASASQTIYSNTVAEDASKAFSTNYQDLYLNQGR